MADTKQPAKRKAAQIRRDPEDPGRVAIKTGAGVTAGEWFVYDVDHGGGYTDGEREGVADWPASG
jgi:hypothetical protein